MIKTEHAGAKNGGGYWGNREHAKTHCKSLRRAADKREAHPVERAKRHGKKDTRRWCLGRVGRAHAGVCLNYYKAKGWTWPSPPPKWLVLVCTRCGRELEHWHGTSDKRPRPEWAR